MPLIVADSVRKKQVETTVTIRGGEEQVQRLLAFLAAIQLSASWGHSGLFAIPWDGDGSDRIEIVGPDMDDSIAKAKGAVEALASYGGDVEILNSPTSAAVGTIKDTKLVYKDKRLY